MKNFSRPESNINATVHNLSHKPRHIVITCGVLRKELSAWPDRKRFGLEFLFLPSSLDLDFDRMQKYITRALQKIHAANTYSRAFVLYGQCHPNIADFVQGNGGELVHLGNCYEMLLGKTSYRKLLAAGTYFLLPQWAGYWNKVFTKNLGFNEKIGQISFPEMHTHACYLDTGFVYKPQFEPQSFTAFTRLDVQIKKLNIDDLYDRLNHTFSHLLKQELLCQETLL